MIARGIFVLTAFVVLVAATGAASAQIPDEFTNLKVLPKDIGKRELIGVMRNFAGGLGVRCTHCHPGKTPGTLEGVDFASDELETKRVTRAMMKMVGEINGRLVPAAGLKSPAEVRCVTCHRGLEEPETLDRVLLGVAEEKGVAAAEAKYRELREQYYGAGSYAFGSGTLDSVAETLAQEKQDLDGAIAIMRLNVEFNPDAAFSHAMLGQFYATKGEKTKAIAAVERSLEIFPDNRRAKQLLDQLRADE